MKVNLFIKIQFVAIVVAAITCAEVSFQPKPRIDGIWQADSLFVGADIVSIDSSKEVIVTWLRSKFTDGLGELYFMIPNHQDSAKFLFHSLHYEYPNEPISVNLGHFPANTKLVFMYKVVDTSAKWQYYYNKRLYSGQNRDTIDSYVSDRPKNDLYGKRYSAVGQVSAEKVEVGFMDECQLGFWNIMFEVSGAVLKKE